MTFQCTTPTSPLSTAAMMTKPAPIITSTLTPTLVEML
ncbi:hypothetical protein OIU84_000465, partial [Salix udensis]